MKTLIINGSPKKNGNTVFLINELKSNLKGEIAEISAYYDKIAPCIDCGYCRENAGCSIHDKMDVIYADDFDNIVIASPIHMSNLPGPLVSIASRLQVYYASKRFLNHKINLRKKEGVLMLTGGGDGRADCAIASANVIFRLMNASHRIENRILSLNTDKWPACEDMEAVKKIEEITESINAKYDRI